MAILLYLYYKYSKVLDSREIICPEPKNESGFDSQWSLFRGVMKAASYAVEAYCIIKFMLWHTTRLPIPTPIRANSYTAAIRNAISLGGDAYTMACMAGGIAIATKGMEMPEDLAYYIYNHVLDDYLRHVLYEFNQLSPL